MAFDITATPIVPVRQELKFPLLREWHDPESDENGQVVLFTDYCTGVGLNAVSDDVDVEDIGKEASDWIDVRDPRWVSTKVVLHSGD